jgi:cytoskeleton protein RodZ
MEDSGGQEIAPDGRGPPAVSVGKTLSQARLAQGLSVEDVAAELRIEVKQLMALEQDRFDQIGVPVFIKGYLRQYGQRLGLSYNDLLSLYYRQVDTQEVDIRPSRTIKLRDERQITVWVLALLALGVLGAFLAVWWFNDPGLQRAIRPRAEEAPPAVEPSAAPAEDPAGGAGREAERRPTGVLGAPAANAASAVDTAPAPAVAREAVSPAPAQEATPVPGEDLVAAADTAPAGVELDVSFDEDSWAEITDSRGERLFYGLGHAGRSVQLHGEPPFATLLGNAAGVRLLLDGKPYRVPGQGRSGNRVRFAITFPEE